MPDGLSVSVESLAPRKGRGAVTNPPVRFESTAREAFDDGWGSLADFSDLPPLPTTLPPCASSSSKIMPNSRNNCAMR